MRLIIHTKVGTFVKDNARKIDKRSLLASVTGYRDTSGRDTFEITGRPAGSADVPESRCVFFTSDYRYLEIEDD
jgi:hypothetical protein